MNERDRRELLRLSSALVDGSITRSQFAQLDELLRESREARLLYLGFKELDSELCEQLQELPGQVMEATEAYLTRAGARFDRLEVAGDCLPTGAPSLPSGGSVLARLRVAAAAVLVTAAALLVAVTLFRNSSAPPTSPRIAAGGTAANDAALTDAAATGASRDALPDNGVAAGPAATVETVLSDAQAVVAARAGAAVAPLSAADLRAASGVAGRDAVPVAVLNDALGAVWSGGALTVGDAIYPGLLKLDEGVVRFDFFSGARVIFEGPAVVEFLSEDRLRCISGKLHAHVPELARGFTIETPDGRVVDFGTQFSIVVDESVGTDVYVEDGVVEVSSDRQAVKAGGQRKRFTAGQKARLSKEGLESLSPQPIDVVDGSAIHRMVGEHYAEVESRWQRARQTWREDPDALLYFDFQESDNTSRVLTNLVGGLEGDRASDGVVIGAAWTRGRFPNKKALAFSSISDQVRVAIPGSHKAITMAAWVKPRPLSKQYTSLLLTDGWDAGEPHWQFYRHLPEDVLPEGFGSRHALQFGVHTPNPRPLYRGALTEDVFGRWVHLAVTFDSANGEVLQYLNGEPCQQSYVYDGDKAGYKPAPVRFGTAHIANWYPKLRANMSAATASAADQRGFSGVIDEFLIVARALTPSELLELYQSGAPEGFR